MRLLLFCLIFFTQCAGRVTKSATYTESDLTSLNKLVVREVGATHTQSFNASKTYLLAVSDKGATNVMSRYSVVEVGTLKVLKTGTFRPGYIKWKDDQSLELLNAPGAMPTGKSMSDYIEVIYIPANK